MSKYLFVLGRDEEPLARRCLRLAKLAVVKGHEVRVFLMDEAVHLTQGIARREPDSLDRPQDEVGQLYRFLRDAGAAFHVDRNSVRSRLPRGASLPRGMQLACDMQLIDMAEDSKVFSL